MFPKKDPYGIYLLDVTELFYYCTAIETCCGEQPTDIMTLRATILANRLVLQPLELLS